MSPESLFRRDQGYISIRLALEEWAELPAGDSPEWRTLRQLIEATINGKHSRVFEMERAGNDLYLLLALDLNTAVEATVASLRRQLHDPFWRPFLDLERFAWLGDYHVMGVRPGDTLAAQPLEHPARSGKRKHVQYGLGRVLEHPWHDAPSPDAVGIEFVRCLRHPASNRVDLLYRKPENDAEATAAAQLNTRLRLAARGPRLESVGWETGHELPALVFSVPPHLLEPSPNGVEVWWATDQLRLISTVPCEWYKPGLPVWMTSPKTP